MSAILSMIQISTSANAYPLEEEDMDNFVPYHDAYASLDEDDDGIDYLICGIWKCKKRVKIHFRWIYGLGIVWWKGW